MTNVRDGEGRRPIPADEDGPPGTSRNPITGEARDRHLIGGANQHDLSDEDSDTDTVNEYHGLPAARSAPQEV